MMLGTTNIKHVWKTRLTHTSLLVRILLQRRQKKMINCFRRVAIHYVLLVVLFTASCHTGVARTLNP